MPQMSLNRSLFIASTVLASTSLPAIASAQGEVNALEEIFITAQKREQSLKDVPVTVSALTGDLLTRLNATEFEEISPFIPGRTVHEQAQTIQASSSGASPPTQAQRKSHHGSLSTIMVWM